MRTLRARVLWEPRDLWVGVYWDRGTFSTHLYFCLIPCFPLHVWWMTAPCPPFPPTLEEDAP